METIWRDAIERFGVETAPPELHLTHSLLNSFGPATFSEMEMLDDLASAQAWLHDVLRQWREAHPDAGPPEIPVSAATIRSIKQLRDEVRKFLGDASLSAEAWSAPVQISLHEGRFEVVPQGSGAGWLRSAVSSELLLAQEHDLRRRFKVCRNPACLVAFYDRSKSNTRVWHDMARCGTPQHVREWRRRQRTADTPDSVVDGALGDNSVHN